MISPRRNTKLFHFPMLLGVTTSVFYRIMIPVFVDSSKLRKHDHHTFHVSTAIFSRNAKIHKTNLKTLCKFREFCVEDPFCVLLKSFNVFVCRNHRDADQYTEAGAVYIPARIFIPACIAGRNSGTSSGGPY